MTTAVAPPVNGPAAPGNGKRRRGLFDATLMAILLYAVYAKTPLGAIAETAVNVARGQKDRPSWIATFKGRETSVSVDANAVVRADAAAGGELPLPIRLAADKHKVDAEAIAAIISIHGACAGTVCDAATPPRAHTLLPGAAGKTRLDADELAQALATARHELGPDAELGIEAMWIGAIPVRLASEQAVRSNKPDPGDAEQHAEFLSPSTRRGPLQGALAVIAVHRLRTVAWPADTKYRITSPYGMRTHPITGKQSFHNGTDIGTPTGATLYAAHKGVVKRRSRDSMSGEYVILNHGLGIETVYCHMSAPAVEEGAPIKRKASIGLSGASGRVTGPHVHYILRVNEKSVDPEKYGESPTRSGAIEKVEVPPPVEDKPPPPKPAKPPKKPKPMKPGADAGPAPDAVKPEEPSAAKAPAEEAKPEPPPADVPKPDAAADEPGPTLEAPLP